MRPWIFGALLVAACGDPGEVDAADPAAWRLAGRRVGCDVTSSNGQVTTYLDDEKGRPLSIRTRTPQGAGVTSWAWSDSRGGFVWDATIERVWEGRTIDRAEERYEGGRIVFRTGLHWVDETWERHPRGRVVAYDGAFVDHRLSLTRSHDTRGRLVGWTRVSDPNPDNHESVTVQWEGDLLQGWSTSHSSLTWTAHDSAGRPLTGEGHSYRYDGTHSYAWSETWAWDDQGRPTAHTAQNGVRTWTWGDRGGEVAWDGEVVETRTWDEAGHLLSFETESGRAEYVWHGDRLIEAADDEGNWTTWSRGCPDSRVQPWSLPTLYPVPPPIPAPYGG